MNKISLLLTIISFQFFSYQGLSQVAPFIAFHASDSNGVVDCQQIDTNICFTIFQHSGIVDAVNNGLFLMDYNTLTFAIPGWYSDDGISFYFWSGSGWDPCVEYCGLPPIVILGDSVVNANSAENYSVIDTAGSSYYWVITSGSVISGQGSGNVQVQWGAQGNGMITLIQTAINGCVDTLFLSATILGNTGIHKITTSNINAYPNPTKKLINIYINDYKGPIDVEVYDLYGRLLETKQSNTLDIELYSKGLYIFKVLYNNTYSSISVIKE